MLEGRFSPSVLRPRSQPVLWMAIFLALGTLGVAPAVAVSPAPLIRIEPTTLYFGAASPPASVAGSQAPMPAPGLLPRPEVPAALRQKAARPEGVRVLVQLATPFVPEGRLSTVQQRRDQRLAIARTQTAALAGLARSRAKVIARYKFIPFLALQVDATALDTLAGLPEFAGVQEDLVDHPSLASSTAVIGAGVAWSLGLTLRPASRRRWA